MKKISIILLLLSICTSCEISKEYKYSVYTSTTNLLLSSVVVKCDSFNMISSKEIIIYSNGVKQKIYAEYISVRSN